MKTFRTSKRLPFYMCLGCLWLLLSLSGSFLTHQETFNAELLNEIWRAVFLTALNFIFFEFSLPLMLRPRKNVVLTLIISILLTALQLILVSFGLYFWNELGKILGIYTQLRHTVLLPNGLYNVLIDEALYQGERGLLSMVFFGLAKLLHYNFNLKQTAQQLRMERQEAELSFLKTQTNPHFLFNTLNNIYALAKEKSDLAPESILRLSKILRFMLYETTGKFIEIAQEIEIINDYINLEKLRYDDSLEVSFSHRVEDDQLAVPPLLLIPLVENAFKHGLSESEKPFLKIDLEAAANALSFSIVNSIADGSATTEIRENIGLSGLRRQLELLYRDYSLSVGQDAKQFTVVLKINLQSHV